jgi:hypothetical protein
MSSSQCPPAQPATHEHEYSTTHAASVQSPSLHVAPFMHGVDEHSSMFTHVLPPSTASYPG